MWQTKLISDGVLVWSRQYPHTTSAWHKISLNIFCSLLTIENIPLATLRLIEMSILNLSYHQMRVTSIENVENYYKKEGLGFINVVLKL